MEQELPLPCFAEGEAEAQGDSAMAGGDETHAATLYRSWLAVDLLCAPERPLQPGNVINTPMYIASGELAESSTVRFNR